MKLNFFKKNWFKVTATIVVIIFALIVVSGLVRLSHYRSSFVKMDNAQIDTAKGIAVAALEAQGKNSSEYEVRVMPQFRKMQEKNDSISLVEVSFFNPSEMQLFLIDINSNEILMRTETNYYKTSDLIPGPRMGCPNKLVPELVPERGNDSERPCAPPTEDPRWFHGNFVR